MLHLSRAYLQEWYLPQAVPPVQPMPPHWPHSATDWATVRETRDVRATASLNIFLEVVNNVGLSKAAEHECRTMFYTSPHTAAS